MTLRKEFETDSKSKIKMKKKSKITTDSIFSDISHLKKASLYSRLAIIFALIGFSLVFVSYVPAVWFWTFESENIKSNSEEISITAQRASNAYQKGSALNKKIYLPPLDPSFPLDNLMIIKTLGIDAKIHEATNDNYETALKKGVWRVFDFGDPEDRSVPMILAAHRFGYLSWSIPYRLKNSFYRLPKLEVGDTVEIIWEQRKYTYAVYKQEKGEEITDYSADLILYTCQDLNSSVKVFKYARLLEI